MGKKRKQRTPRHGVPVTRMEERWQPDAGSLGSAMQAEGQVIGRATRGVTGFRFERAACSCRG
jgi:hypothetical protein